MVAALTVPAPLKLWTKPELLGGFLVPKEMIHKMINFSHTDGLFAQMRNRQREEIIMTYQSDISVCVRPSDAFVIDNEPEETWDEDGE